MRKFFEYFLYILFIPFWWIQKLIPRNKNVWVFGAWFGQKYSDNAKVLFEYTVSKNRSIHPIWLTNNKKIYNELTGKQLPVAMKNSAKGILFSLIAGKVIFSSGKSDINKFFINGAKTILTWHGAPMKKIGLDDKYVHIKFIDNFKRFILPFIYEYNISNVVSTAKIFNAKLASAFNLPIQKILLTGYPRNDIFYSSKKHSFIKNIKNKFHQPKIILYLPTFRDKNTKTDLFKNYGFDPNEFKIFLDQINGVLITKGHFVDRSLSNIDSDERIINLSDKDIQEINPILKDVDILLTDYSGAYFDFLLTLKPIIFTAFDFKTYINKYRELYFDYNDVISGQIVRNWPEVKCNIEAIITNDKFLSIRKEKNQIFNHFQDDKSTERLYCAINEQ